MSSSECLALKAIVVDWAGTIIDHGTRAPVEAFREIFRRRGMPITAEEARGPMGMEKRDHIAALVAVPRVAEAWRAAHGHSVTDDEITAMYHEFLPVQMELLPQHADVIPGVIDALAECRRRGLKIGSSSGYATPLMTRLAALAKDNGLEVDAIVSASEVPAGRPAPWMIFKNMELLVVYPPSATITVDDTTVGIEAGRNAGTWTVGVVETGNVLGLSSTELQQLDRAERERRTAIGRKQMLAAGAHYALNSVANLPTLIDEIAARLVRGERP
jgi:phosphonoacetaldehyde hydrolase